MANVLQARVAAQRFELRAEFGNDLLQSFGIEATHRLGQRTKRRAWTAELLLHVLKFAGLLQATQRSDDGIEQVEQNQHAVVIEVQRTIAGSVAVAADLVQAFEQGRKLIEVLEAAHIGLANRRLGTSLRLHAPIMINPSCWRNTVRMYFRERKCRAEQHWDAIVSPFAFTSHCWCNEFVINWPGC